jgi:hypothetical protein
MRPNQITYTPADDSAAGLGDDLADSAAGVFTLTATAADDGLAHLVTILGNAATNHSNKTFTVTGTNANGAAQTEDITGPNGVATVASTKYFLTVTSITVAATTGADTFDFGWTDDIVGPTYPLDWRSPYAANIYVDISGTIDFDIQQTFDNVLAGDTPSWVAISALDSKTADTYGNAAVGATAIRLLLNSLTAGATIKITTNQASAD